MKLWHLFLTLSGLCATLALGQSLETTDRYGDPFIVYAQVDRADGTYRRMLTTPDVLEVAQSEHPLPDGARILMETYYRPADLSTVFHARKVDGAWEYGSFNGQGAVRLETRPQASCLSCHAAAGETDFIFTKPALEMAKSTGESRMRCDRGGRRPCSLGTYDVRKTQ